MILDSVFARLTRRVPRFSGWHGLLEPVRRHEGRLARADREHGTDRSLARYANSH